MLWRQNIPLVLVINFSMRLFLLESQKVFQFVREIGKCFLFRCLSLFCSVYKSLTQRKIWNIFSHWKDEFWDVAFQSILPLFRRCDICNRIFVDDQDIAKKLARKCVITKINLKPYPAGELMDLANANTVASNMFWLEKTRVKLRSSANSFWRLQTIFLVSMFFTFKFT